MSDLREAIVDVCMGTLAGLTIVAVYLTICSLIGLLSDKPTPNTGFSCVREYRELYLPCNEVPAENAVWRHFYEVLQQPVRAS